MNRPYKRYDYMWWLALGEHWQVQMVCGSSLTRHHARACWQECLANAIGEASKP